MWPDLRRVRATLAQARVTAAAVIETLEQRQLLSVTVIDPSAPTALLDGDGALQGTARIEDGVLRVVATARNDEIQLGSTSQPGGIYFWVNGAGAQVDAALVRGIRIDAGDGDDMVYYNNLGGLLNLPTTINGGGGNDDLTGEDDRDCSDHAIAFRDRQASYAKVVLDGGDGNDRLMARIGDTTLIGGSGDDRIFAEAGYDTWGHNTVIDDPPSAAANVAQVVAPAVFGPQPAGHAPLATSDPDPAPQGRVLVTPPTGPNPFGSTLIGATEAPPSVLEAQRSDAPWNA